ncbi:MAG: HAD hydrolase-like protein [Verrucomicrobiota bacterium]
MTLPPQQLRALVFDFDGTIADTFERAVRISNHLAGEHGFKRIEQADLPHAKNLSATQFARFLGIRKRQIPSLLYQGKRLMREDIAEIGLIDGMGAVLKQLRYTMPVLGILTSNSVENVTTFLAAHDLELFDFIHAIPKLSGKSKQLRAILRTYNLRPGELGYVGDEMRDIKAARRSRCYSIAVSWGFNSRQALASQAPHELLDEPAQLCELLATQTIPDGISPL